MCVLVRERRGKLIPEEKLLALCSIELIKHAFSALPGDNVNDGGGGHLQTLSLTTDNLWEI